MSRPIALLITLATAALPAAAQPVTAAAPSCESGLDHLNPIFGWQIRWAQQLRDLAADPGKAPARDWHQAAAGVRSDIAALQRLAAAGRTAPAPVVDRVLAQATALQAQLAETPLADGPAWHTLLDTELRPAIDAYVAFLRAYRAKATPGSVFATLPDPDACFAQAVTSWTTLQMSPAELEATGHALLAEARRDLAKAAGVSEAEVPRILAELRRGTPGVSRDELLGVSEAALGRARRAMPRAFNVGDLPPIVIEPLPAALEGEAVTGIYRQAEGAAPAAYIVNLARPSERRLMAEVIAFHETFPGHHLAVALRQGPGSFNSGYVEGWAIYAEYLADELGLYGTPRDRIGMHAKHLWAASRLIIEPGLHVRGWTRQQAIAFMHANTALSDSEIAVEVDRYLALPGQSLGYMLGADRFRTARARAEAALGPTFDLRAFHDVVLRAGPRRLDEVDADVDAWIARSRAKG